MYKQLKYRRQFLISKIPIDSLDKWTCLDLGDLYLYAHPDLEVHNVANQNQRIVLLGNMFDAEVAEKGNVDLVADLLARTGGLNDFLTGARQYAGNYALLYQSDQDMVIMQDALALREIYYCTEDNKIISGSQPNLMLSFAAPAFLETNNLDLLDFYKNYLKDASWIGDETLYQGVKRLLPNHYLDIRARKVHRYWPNKPVRRLDLDEAVSQICPYLQGIMKSMANRHSLMLAVTSGTDSRTLLAASRDLREKIYYYINNHNNMGYSHPDIYVPQAMFDKIGIPFHVHDISSDIDEEFKRIYFANTFFRTERLMTSIYNVYFKNHGEKVNITSTGEIGRSRYGTADRRLNSYLVAYKLGQNPRCRYVNTQSKKILKELNPVARKFGVNMLTLLYWEQKIGIWGTIVNSESDIAIEELDPYDSHLLCELLLGVDEKYTRYDEQPCCVLFQKMIKTMWPELMEWPINPPYTKRDKIVDLLTKMGMSNPLREIKYQISYMRYLFEHRP